MLRWREVTAGALVVLCLVGIPAAALAYESARRAQAITIELSQWQYSPSEIRLKKGQEVRLRLFAKDVVHGFQIANLADVTVQPGKVKELIIRAEEPGIYRFRCSMFCGLGHGAMSGQIVVEE